MTLCRQISASPGLRFDGLMGYEGHTLMIADPAEKRAAIASAIAKLLETRDLAEPRATVPNHLRWRIGIVPVHGRYRRSYRDSGRWGDLRLPVLHPMCQVEGPPPCDQRSGDRCQPPCPRSSHPRHRPEVDQPAPNSTSSARLPRLPSRRAFGRARDDCGRFAE